MAIVYLWYSVPDSVHCLRASDLPRLGLARDPAGVALAAPISARTTSRPETRINRRTGDPPPTPHHVLGTRRTQLSTRTTPSPDAAGPTGASGDSDTNTKARRNKDVWAGRPGMTTPSTCHGAPPGRFRDHRPKPRHTGRQPETGKSVTQCQLEHEPDLGQARGAR